MRPPGFKHTEETKKKMSQVRVNGYKNKTFKGGFKKGLDNIMHKPEQKSRTKLLGLSNKGRKHSDEVNKKKGRPGLLVREKNPAWRGGKSFEEYPKEFLLIKEKIRCRDNHRCRKCKTYRQNIKLHVHHIDYNKKNNDPKNLISLCAICHNQTQKDREKCTIFFNKMMENISCDML